MSKVEKIKAEIERLKESLPWGSCASQISMECDCKDEAYNEVLSYINSLEEEQVSEEFINALGTMLNDGLPDRYLVSEERIKKSAELLFSIALKQLKNEMQEWSEEVDLEKEAENFVQTGEFVKNENPVLAIAKHFFELGLKAQKGE